MKEAMYRENAKYYDLIYSWKDYKKEVQELKKIITKHRQSKGKDLLDVACGTGKHLEQFKGFKLHGSDLNKGILSVAKRRLPKATFYHQDMTRLRIPKQFDIITCLFSSIGYVTSKPALRRTIKNFAEHIKPGGVIIIEPWLGRSVFAAGSPHMTTYDGKDIKIARLTVSEIKGDLSILDMHWLVAERGEKVRSLRDLHTMRLTPHEELVRMMQGVGLEASYIKSSTFSRGLLIGVKPSS